MKRQFRTFLLLGLLVSLFPVQGLGQSPGSDLSGPDTVESSRTGPGEDAGTLFGPSGTDTATDPNSAAPLITGGWIWRYSLSLCCLAALMGGLFLLLRKLRDRIPSGAPEHQVKVLSRTVLDQKSNLVLVRVRGEDLLIGCGSGNVNVLAKYDPGREDRENGESTPEKSAPGEHTEEEGWA